MRTRKVGVTSLLDQFGEDRRGRFGEDVLEGGGIPDEDRVEAEPAQRGGFRLGQHDRDCTNTCTRLYRD